MNLTCPHCSQEIEADDERAGRDVQCPGCGRFTKAPVPPPATSPPPVVGGSTLKMSVPRASAPRAQRQEVVITDIDMPIPAIMRFMVKCLIAWLPIGIGLAALAALVGLTFAGAIAAALQAFLLQGR